MVPALASGAVEAAIVLEPFLSESIQAGIARPLSDLVAATGGTSTASATSVPLVYSEAFAANRPTAQAFMDAYLSGVRLYNDAFTKGIDKDKVIAILAARAKLAPAVIRNGFPAGLDPNGRVNLDFLAECQRYFIAQHFLDTPIELSRLVDPSFANDTVARLGEYHVA
jgi:NitT/TauT family transport system substrate-binding protein